MTKRNWHLVLVFLFVGALLNVVVAGTCATIAGGAGAAPPPHYRLPTDAERSWWLRMRPADLVQSAGVVKSDRCFGFQAVRIMGDMGGKLTPSTDGRQFIMGALGLDEEWHYEIAQRSRSGWPLSAFEGAIWGSVGPGRSAPAKAQWLLRSPDWWGPAGGRPLPYHPLWPGLIVNSIILAFTAYLPLLIGVHLRRFLRVRRGQCKHCGYPIGVSERCTECGAAVAPRRLTQSQPMNTAQRDPAMNISREEES